MMNNKIKRQKVNNKLQIFWTNNKLIFLFVSLLLVFRSAVADWNRVPTGSMKPTIVEGDRIFVNKMAYDLRLPFTHISLVTIADPEPGDIIIFDSVAADKKLVKRVIGIPGDAISMIGNVLSINGQALSYQPLKSNSDISSHKEILFGKTHSITIKREGSSLSSFSEVTVPENQFLVLGDNRDNSADSRVIGFVPRAEIVGQANKVIMSLDYDNYYLPRFERFFKSL
jgi:signal peptidase I